jgi:hypothetical protein
MIAGVVGVVGVLFHERVGVSSPWCKSVLLSKWIVVSIPGQQ